MERPLIIGIGNPLRGDDGFGWHVIEKLQEGDAAERADLVTCHQLTPEIAVSVAPSPLVVFVDAAQGGPAGEVEVQRIRIHQVQDSAAGGACLPGALSHRLDPPELVRYAKTLYGNCPEAVVVSVKGAAYGFSEELSAPVLAAVPRVLRLVEDLLAVPCAWDAGGLPT